MWKRVKKDDFGGCVTEIYFDTPTIYSRIHAIDTIRQPKPWTVFKMWCDKQEWTKEILTLDVITPEQFEKITEVYNLNDLCSILRDMNNYKKITKNKSIAKTAQNWLRRNNTKKKGVHQ